MIVVVVVASEGAAAEMLEAVDTRLGLSARAWGASCSVNCPPVYSVSISTSMLFFCVVIELRIFIRRYWQLELLLHIGMGVLLTLLHASANRSVTADVG